MHALPRHELLLPHRRDEKPLKGSMLRRKEAGIQPGFLSFTGH